MKTFSIVLKELMEENSVDVKSLAKHLEFSSASIVYEWLRCEKSLLLPTAVKIADFFRCPLDYLFGRSDDFNDRVFQECPPFDMQLKKVLNNQKISQYNLTKNKIVSGASIDAWLNKKQIPHIDSIIKLADYLNVTMDFLVGREN